MVLAVSSSKIWFYSRSDWKWKPIKRSHDKV